MINYKLMIGKNRTYTDCTKLVIKASVNGRRGDAPRTFSATLSDTEDHERVAANCGEGQSVLFYVDGKEEFRGLLMTDTRCSNRTLAIKAYDNCIFLCNNKDSFTFKKKTATEIFKECLKRLGLKCGGAVNTVHVIGELVKKNTTYWDVIQDALSQTYKSTGVRYYVISIKGKIYLKKREMQDTMPILELKSNIYAYDMQRSIYNTRTRLTLMTSKGVKKGSAANTNLEKKIGKFQDVETVDEDITSTEINQRINVFRMETSIVSKELKVTAIGNIRCISGSCVYVKIPQVNEKRKMYIEEDTHTFEEGHHKMVLKLDCYTTSDKDTANKADGKSGGNQNYKVTARSGLNMRTGPNQDILLTIPYGSTVSSDGNTDGNWVHICYNGKWGYSYSSWLEGV